MVSGRRTMYPNRTQRAELGCRFFFRGSCRPRCRPSAANRLKAFSLHHGMARVSSDRKVKKHMPEVGEAGRKIMAFLSLLSSRRRGAVGGRPARLFACDVTCKGVKICAATVETTREKDSTRQMHRSSSRLPPSSKRSRCRCYNHGIRQSAYPRAPGNTEGRSE